MDERKGTKLKVNEPVHSSFSFSVEAKEKEGVVRRDENRLSRITTGRSKIVKERGVDDRNETKSLREEQT